ncbi:MAG: ORF67A [Human gammaherpesvirus 8]|uniref:ORF67A n=1 Tax=Human herpesvirus 8 TaxID=37296 RepID=A0A0N9RP30_HHV8|nr:ORF67A [Human gammaherpesvirus 8]ALH44403.1 ORF67A [Human gammaherpesvirus 8]ALH44578.1 ORF67A [Human gammaherpesvirus 8]ALH44666.1 ORF67A [Human gammaherpesvirus 8]ALH44754.1 ORF67A [Human gammaherpesvirus 8]
MEYASDKLLPRDMQILFPTIYCRLNAINYCQYLKTFLVQRAQPAACDHTLVLESKVDTVRQVLRKIVSTDAVFSEARARP